MRAKFIAITLILGILSSLLCLHSVARSEKEINSSTDVSVSSEMNFTEENLQEFNNNTNFCRHGIACEFDDETMTLTNAYEGNCVEDIISDIEFYDQHHSVEILYNGIGVTQGELQEGMIIKIYHDNTLYGEYSIDDIKTFSRARNAYGFILPIDNIILSSSPGGNISQYYSTGHKAIDIANGGTHYGTTIQGATVRAVREGTVSWVQEWDGVTKTGNQSYGHCVKINHYDGTYTLYAHMLDKPTLSEGQYVAQGHPLGQVGTSGNTTGPHLHFEVYQGVNLVNPLPYLTGAPTYSSNTFTIKYYPNGGSGTMADTIVTYGASTPTRTNTFTYPGHIFTGWHVANLSTGTWRYYNPSNPSQTGWYAQGSQPSGWEKLLYENGESVGWTVEPGQVASFYAVWTYGFVVKYNANGGSGSMADTIVRYGVSTPTRMNTFTRTGHVFTGWNVKNNSTGKWRYYNPNNTSETGWYAEGSQPSGWQKMVYENGESIGWTAEPGETITFYAVWEII